MRSFSLEYHNTIVRVPTLEITPLPEFLKNLQECFDVEILLIDEGVSLK